MQSSNKKHGFTLVEIMIVVAIVGILVALGIPYSLGACTRSRAACIAHEYKNNAKAFTLCYLQNATYPADEQPGIAPNDIIPFLKKSPWDKETIIGGNWDWDYNQFGVKAAVSIDHPKWDENLMKKVDDLLDDGNLLTGDFRSRSGGYMYILEEN